MDAGVPIKKPVAGIAMGLIEEELKKTEHLNSPSFPTYRGMEDFLGDMDFKVTGTDEGVTAIQMDIRFTDCQETSSKRL